METTTVTTDRLRDILDRIEAFVEAEVVPLEAATRGKTWAEIVPLLEEKRQRVKAAGLWTPHLPEAWGGLGLSLAAFGRVNDFQSIQKRI